MCSDSPSPDPQIGAAALANAAIAKDALEYYKQRDAAQQPRQERMDALAGKIVDQQLASSRFNDQQARDMYARYQAEGIPAEDRMYADAAGYDSKAELDRAAGQASTDVAAQLGAANDARRRALARSGVNPADGRALAMEQDAATQGALGTADAMNKARDSRRLQGIMLRKDAAGFARGMPGTAAQTFGTAMAAGGQASGAQAAAIGTANQSAQTMGTGFGLGIQGNASAGSILNQEYGTQVQANNSGSTLGSLGQLGMGLGAMGYKFSDENMKEGRAPVDANKALKGVRGVKVESWTYKPDSPAADGGQPHIGAMAQDLQKHLGDTVAPGGTMVDPVSAIGATMAAVQALDKKVSRMAARGTK